MASTRFSFERLVNQNSAAHRHAEAVAKVIDAAGYAVVSTVAYADPSSMGDDILFAINFTKDSHAYTGKIQIRRTPRNELRVHAATGFPDEVLALILDVPKAPSQRAGAKGDQALQENHPAQAQRRADLGEESPADAQPGSLTGTQATAAMAVSIIDLVNVQKELASRRTRRYIGASGIGESCSAYQALSLRGFPSDLPDAKLLRIFREGHRIETMVVEDLKDAGHVVEEVDPNTGEQWEYTSHGDHHVAHLDGFITLVGTTERRTLEIKSMNKAMFAKFKNKGVAVSHPEYRDQCIDGLGLARSAGVQVESCFLVAFCKDNSEYHAEIVQFDQERFDFLWRHRVLGVMNGISTRESSYAKAFKCSQCFKKTACWEPSSLEFTRECHHCDHASPSFTRGGKQWWCGMTQSDAVAVCKSFKPFRVTKHV